MPDVLFIDTGPLGVLVKDPTNPQAAAGQRWLRGCLTAGQEVYLPEIADYELRRELMLNGLNASIRRLDKLKAELKFRRITPKTMLLAADLWARMRKRGIPTADRHALDGDVILAAQMLSLSPQPAIMHVVTTNLNHLSRLVACIDWQTIVP